MRYEKIILVRIIYFLRQYLYGWLLVFRGRGVVQMRTSCRGDPSSTACGSHTRAPACGTGTAIRPSA
jgi:hypothetical protein